MSLSQMQIIQSLAEALAWFEKELAWGVDTAELRHLTGRIGELYAAIVTRGQMALATNQRGYDVVTGENERLSVKAVTSSTHVSFRKSTFADVDRVIILRIHVEDGEAAIEEVLDQRVSEFLPLCLETATEYRYALRHKPTPRRPTGELEIAADASIGHYRILQYESGTIQVQADGVQQPMAKPILRQIAVECGVDLLNGSGNPKNTRQLGDSVIKALSLL